MKFKSLGVAITAMTFVMIVLSSILVGGVSYIMLHKDATRMHAEEAEVIAKSALAAIDGDEMQAVMQSGVKTDAYLRTKAILDGIKANNDLAYLYVLGSGYDTHCYYYMEGYSESNPEAMLDLGDAERIDAYAQEMFETLRSGEQTLTEIYHSVGFGKMISAFQPVRNSAGQIVGVIGVDMSADRIQSVASGFLLNLLFVVAGFCVVAVLVMRRLIARMVDKPIEALTKASGTLAEGDTEVDVSMLRNANEIGRLATSFDEMVESTRQQVQVLQALADGDLCAQVHPRGERDEMGQAIRSTLQQLGEVFAAILQNARQVSMGAQQIADVAQTLARGSTEQASSIANLSDTITDLGERTTRNVDRAAQAEQLSRDIRQNAEQGSQQMGRMTGAVEEIGKASKAIDHVIKVIDDIAFQTNILALNAAVEAARAGQHGKGFAVVADEVRNLASKSAEAAQETARLIDDCIAKSKLGAEIAEQTAAAFSDISGGIAENQELVTRITRSIEGQRKSIDLIQQEADQINQVAQANLVTSQQSASASEEMRAQAAELARLASQFKLPEQGGGPVVRESDAFTFMAKIPV